MFELLRMATLVGFNPSGPDSADKMVSDECNPVYQRAVARRSSHLADFNQIGELAVHCADGNMPGRWDRPVFPVATTIEEMSGDIFYLIVCFIADSARRNLRDLFFTGFGKAVCPAGGCSISD